MKYLFVALIFTFLGVQSHAQATFEVVETNNVSNIQEYQSALLNGDFKNHHYRDQRRMMTFESGVKVELLSLNELESLGISIAEYKEAPLREPHLNPTYRLHESGVIIEIQPLLSK